MKLFIFHVTIQGLGWVLITYTHLNYSFFTYHCHFCSFLEALVFPDELVYRRKATSGLQQLRENLGLLLYDIQKVSPSTEDNIEYVLAHGEESPGVRARFPHIAWF